MVKAVKNQEITWIDHVHLDADGLTRIANELTSLGVLRVSSDGFEDTDSVEDLFSVKPRRLRKLELHAPGDRGYRGITVRLGSKAVSAGVSYIGDEGEYALAALRIERILRAYSSTWMRKLMFVLMLIAVFGYSANITALVVTLTTTPRPVFAIWLQIVINLLSVVAIFSSAGVSYLQHLERPRLSFSSSQSSWWRRNSDLIIATAIGSVVAGVAVFALQYFLT